MSEITNKQDNRISPVGGWAIGVLSPPQLRHCRRFKTLKYGPRIQEQLEILSESITSPGNDKKKNAIFEGGGGRGGKFQKILYLMI